ncbi:MAG TPA: hypothetical protein VNM72_01580 [Blastocatellia bacterium]|nr:hypothetical protein [Blastocatellia bacterium]
MRRGDSDRRKGIRLSPHPGEGGEVEERSIAPFMRASLSDRLNTKRSWAIARSLGRRWRRASVCGGAITLALLFLLGRCPGAEGPLRYQSLYRQLERALEAFARRVPDVRASVPIFGAELLPANAHRGPALLRPDTRAGIALYLDALRALGVRGVKVAISYPILSGDDPHRDAYLAFYRDIVREVRQRGMRLLVGTGVLIPDETTGVGPHPGLTMERYREARRQIARTIARELQPDYLTIANEPTTEARATGLRQLADVDEYMRLVRFVLDGLADVRAGIRVGAGAGNWEAVEFVQRLAKMDELTYVDIHVYPATLGLLNRAAEMVRLVRAQGKPVIIGEAWLYKASAPELMRNVAPGPIFARDVFSFWAPLDQKFIEAIVRWASAEGVEFLSFFWSKYFFAYVDYAPAHERLSPARLLGLADAAAARNILRGEVSPTGAYYRTLIAAYAPRKAYHLERPAGAVAKKMDSKARRVLRCVEPSRVTNALRSADALADNTHRSLSPMRMLMGFPGKLLGRGTYICENPPRKREFDDTATVLDSAFL